MNLLRGGTRHFRPQRNIYTGGIERRHTLVRPLTNYARMYSSAAATEEQMSSSGEERTSPSKTVEVDPAILLENKTKRIKELEDSIRDTKDSWKRTLADTDNLSKKMQKDVAKNREGGTDKLARSLFPVTDNMNLCLSNKPDLESDAHKDNIHLRGAFDGLTAAKAQISSVLTSVANVTEIVPQPGDNFDPMLHNAVFEVENSDLEPGSIAVILKSGYSKRDVLVRPADVGIVKYPQKM